MQPPTKGSSETIDSSKDNYFNSEIDPAKFSKGIDDILGEDDQFKKNGSEVENKQTNRFPVEVFPWRVQQIIKETNEKLSYPIDFIAASILYAVSIAIGNTYRIEVKKGWVESSVLYLAIVARAGTNKSHPLRFAIQPIANRDKTTFAQYEKKKKDYEKAISPSKKKEQEKQGFEEPTKPTWSKFLLSDFTPEALAVVHNCNKRGIGVYVDELAGWFKNFNRYNKGSEMEFWISGWSGTQIVIDRKSSDPILIPLPFIPVAGTIQTALLYELAKGDRTLNGFIDRILFVIPDNIQKTYWSETELEQPVIEEWNNILSNLMDLPLHYDDTMNPCPEILKLTAEAKKILFDWQRSNTDQSNDPENEAICGVYSKLEIYAARFALILEMLLFACGEGDRSTINAEAVRGAIKLVEYFKNSAEKVNSIISDASPLDKYSVTQQAFYAKLPENFTTEEALQTAKDLKIPKRNVQRLLNKKELFSRIDRGEYEKRI